MQMVYKHQTFIPTRMKVKNNVVTEWRTLYYCRWIVTVKYQYFILETITISETPIRKAHGCPHYMQASTGVSPVRVFYQNTAVSTKINW